MVYNILAILVLVYRSGSQFLIPCYDPYPYLGGSSNNCIIVRMCIKGTEVESNII